MLKQGHRGELNAAKRINLHNVVMYYYKYKKRSTAKFNLHVVCLITLIFNH